MLDDDWHQGRTAQSTVIQVILKMIHHFVLSDYWYWCMHIVFPSNYRGNQGTSRSTPCTLSLFTSYSFNHSRGGSTTLSPTSYPWVEEAPTASLHQCWLTDHVQRPVLCSWKTLYTQVNCSHIALQTFEAYIVFKIKYPSVVKDILGMCSFEFTVLYIYRDCKKLNSL